MPRPKNCGKCKKPKAECKCGRPEKITKSVLKKLEQAYSLGAGDREAVVHAGISTQTLYNYQKKNKEFIERKKLLKEKLPMRARTALWNGLRNNPSLALQVLERLKKDEFSLRRIFTGEVLSGEMSPKRLAEVRKILGSDNEELFEEEKDEYSEEEEK